MSLTTRERSKQKISSAKPNGSFACFTSFLKAEKCLTAERVGRSFGTKEKTIKLNTTLQEVLDVTEWNAHISSQTFHNIFKCKISQNLCNILYKLLPFKKWVLHSFLLQVSSVKHYYCQYLGFLNIQFIHETLKLCLKTKPKNSQKWNQGVPHSNTPLSVQKYSITVFPKTTGENPFFAHINPDRCDEILK